MSYLWTSPSELRARLSVKPPWKGFFNNGVGRLPKVLPGKLVFYSSYFIFNDNHFSYEDISAVCWDYYPNSLPLGGLRTLTLSFRSRSEHLFIISGYKGKREGISYGYRPANNKELEQLYNKLRGKLSPEVLARSQERIEYNVSGLESSMILASKIATPLLFLFMLYYFMTAFG